MIEQTFKQIPRNILLKNWIEYTVWRKNSKINFVKLDGQIHKWVNGITIEGDAQPYEDGMAAGPSFCDISSFSFNLILK